MKKNQFLLVVLLSIGCAFNSFAQNELKFEVNKVLPFISIQENKLAEINTLTDLDKRYPTSWVKNTFPWKFQRIKMEPKQGLRVPAMS